MEKEIKQININALRFAIQCNFSHFCGEERTQEAVCILNHLTSKIKVLEADNKLQSEVIEMYKNNLTELLDMLFTIAYTRWNVSDVVELLKKYNYDTEEE